MSSIAIQSLFDTNLMRDRNILLGDEKITDVFQRIIQGLVDIEEKYNWTNTEPFCQIAVQFLQEKKLVLGTPILTNVGREQRPTSACVVIPVDLSADLASVERAILPYYENGMGSGFDVSDLENPLRTINQLNEIALNAEKNGLNRPTANMGTLRIDHPCILQFIRHKRNANFYDWRFNLSVMASKEFIEAVKEDEIWNLKDHLGNITESLRAKDIFNELISSIHYCGEPGILFMDYFNEDNPVPHLQYKSTAPCAEVALASGEVCQFSYINLAELIISNPDGTESFDFDTLRTVSSLLVRILDDSVQISIDNSVGDNEVVGAKRRIGIGVCGVADLFIKLKMSYGDSRSVCLIKEILSIINYTSKRASVDLAVQRGSFPAFNASRYLDRDWFFSKTFIHPTQHVTRIMWENLYEDIQSIGLRNAGTCALPPTGTSSRIVFASPSIEPRFSLINQFGEIYPHIYKIIIETLAEKGFLQDEIDNVLIEIKKNGYIINDNIPQSLKNLLKVSHQISQSMQMQIMQNASKYSDESVSKTVNLPNETSIEEIAEIVHSAYIYRIKGITAFRDRCLETRDLNEF